MAKYVDRGKTVCLYSQFLTGQDKNKIIALQYNVNSGQARATCKNAKAMGIEKREGGVGWGGGQSGGGGVAGRGRQLIIILISSYHERILKGSNKRPPRGQVSCFFLGFFIPKIRVSRDIFLNYIFSKISL